MMGPAGDARVGLMRVMVRKGLSLTGAGSTHA